jgi:hypothetical protein
VDLEKPIAYVVRSLPRRRHSHPHFGLVHLSGSSEHAARGASARPRCDPDDAVLAVREGTEATLGLPPDIHSYALLPIGYPLGRFAASRSPMSSTRIDGASLTGICSDHKHAASFPKRLAAQFVILDYRRVRSGKAHWLSNSYRSRNSRVRSKDTCQPHEIGIFVRSTGSLTFREKYSFLTLHPARLLA